MIERQPLARRSVAWRWLSLAAATLWALLVVAVIFGYHIPTKSSDSSATMGVPLYTGHTPALTLYQKGGFTWVVWIIVLGAVIALGAVDLGIRIIRRSTYEGVVAIMVGSLMVLVSFFGLIYGILGFGTVGVLVILSGVPMKPTSSMVNRPSTGGIGAS